MGDTGDVRVTNEVLSVKLDSVSDKIDDLCARYGVTHDQVIVNTSRIGSLEQTGGRPLGQCPLHPAMEEKLTLARIDIARIAVISGISGGGVSILLEGLKRLLKI